MKNIKKIDDVVKTELGIMTVKDYIDICINAKAMFWFSTSPKGRKKYFAGLGNNVIELKRFMYDYAIKNIKYEIDLKR